MRPLIVEGLELQILEPEEHLECIEIIQGELDRLKPQLVDISMAGYRGYDLFMSLQLFESVIGKELPGKVLVSLANASTLCGRLEELMPDYYELPYVHARNSLEAAKTLERHLFKCTVDNIPLITETIKKTFDASERNLVRASIMFEEFAKGKSEVLRAYATQINSYLARIPRAKAWFELVADGPGDYYESLTYCLEQVSDGGAKPTTYKQVISLMPPKLRNMFELVVESSIRYEQLFKTGVIMDEKEAMQFVANYANCLVWFKNIEKNRILGIKYFEAARLILGDDPKILVGLNYLNS